MKRCKGPCKKEKSESEFSIDRTKPDDLRNQCKRCDKEYEIKRKDYHRNYHLEQEFGLLPGEFEKIAKSQDYKCLICNKIKTLVPDHCHKTNKNRGLLCNHCNLLLGWYEKHPAQEYLNKPKWKFLLVWLSPRNYRDSRLRHRYGICLGDYEMMLESQNEVCGICFKICATDRNLAVDHDHKTLRIRGLLCMSCNSNLSWFDNNSINIIKYLT